MSCIVKGCKSKEKSHKTTSFYSFPKVRINDNGVLAERRKLWLKRVGVSENKLSKYTKVCDKHFTLGRPSYEQDVTHTDWAPSLLLELSSAEERIIRSKRRCLSKDIQSVKLSVQSIPKMEISYSASNKSDNSSNKIIPILDVDVSNNDMDVSNDDISMPTFSSLEQCSSNNSSENEDTVKQNGEVAKYLQRIMELEEQLQAANRTIDELNSKLGEVTINNSRLSENLKEKSKDLFTKCVENNELMVYYTRFSNHSFQAMFEALLPVKEHNNCALDLRRQFFLMLLKIAHNFGLRDLAIRFNVSRFTVSDYFHKWIGIVHDRLFSKVIFWPTKEALLKTMPMCFRGGEFENTTAIWDCFEIQTDTPHTPSDQAGSFSYYKQRPTDKILISITPQGTVNFVSNGFCGRVSDKQVVIVSNILDNLQHGDLILADRGFPLEEVVATRGAKFKVPAFMKDKKQLSEQETEETRRIANVRIHVERVIGAIRTRFKILKGPININFLKNVEVDKSFVDKIVKVCCIFSNLLPSVVPLD